MAGYYNIIEFSGLGAVGRAHLRGKGRPSSLPMFDEPLHKIAIDIAGWKNRFSGLVDVCEERVTLYRGAVHIVNTNYMF